MTYTKYILKNTQNETNFVADSKKKPNPNKIVSNLLERNRTFKKSKS